MAAVFLLPAFVTPVKHRCVAHLYDIWLMVLLLTMGILWYKSATQRRLNRITAAGNIINIFAAWRRRIL
jgi:hypothetical protein